MTERGVSLIIILSKHAFKYHPLPVELFVTVQTKNICALDLGLLLSAPVSRVAKFYSWTAVYRLFTCVPPICGAPDTGCRFCREGYLVNADLLMRSC